MSSKSHCALHPLVTSLARDKSATVAPIETFPSAKRALSRKFNGFSARLPPPPLSLSHYAYPFTAIFLFRPQRVDSFLPCLPPVFLLLFPFSVYSLFPLFFLPQSFPSVLLCRTHFSCSPLNSIWANLPPFFFLSCDSFP